VDMEQLCEDRRQCHTSTEATSPGEVCTERWGNSQTLGV